ncbi:MAG: sulfite exporter TauE/SafE family protein [Spirochaetes bacterium]|nr:sulfite exporter TauE/SafE family protein [Spirochaetota bacterium]MCK5268419.1 sulfite exporter TauE/SafE family protein [Spirochaetota bacterium]
MMEILGFALIGIIAGIMSGLLGIGGAIIMIPALIYIFGFEQKIAQGTTLLLMVPPIGLLAAIEYYKAGHTNLKAAIIIAVCFFIGGFFGSKLAMKIHPNLLRKIFAAFLMLVSIRMFFK